MIDEGYRGYLLELMGTKLLCLEQPVQIVAMSATLTVSSIFTCVYRGADAGQEHGPS